MAAEMYEEDLGAPSRRATRKRLSGKKLVLFVILPLLLLILAAAGLWFSGALGPLLAGRGAAGSPAEAVRADQRPVQAVYYDLPDILVNLRTDNPRPSFLKISVALELERVEDRAAVEHVLPRVIDTFQVYLRELRADQLQGSAGLIRLREELLSRINAAVRPTQVKDVLFKEMLIQ